MQLVRTTKLSTEVIDHHGLYSMEFKVQDLASGNYH
jgi:hypothetical protein